MASMPDHGQARNKDAMNGGHSYPSSDLGSMRQRDRILWSQGQKTEPVFVYAVYATEKRPPKG